MSAAAKPKLSYERLRDKTITYLRERGDCMWVDLKLTGSPMLVMKRFKCTTTETIHEPQSFQPFTRLEELVTPRLYLLIFSPGKPDNDMEEELKYLGVQILRPEKVDDVAVALG